MSSCRRCNSFAINDHTHGRETGVDLDLCDVCYWRKRAEEAQTKVSQYRSKYLESKADNARLREALEMLREDYCGICVDMPGDCNEPCEIIIKVQAALEGKP